MVILYEDNHIIVCVKEQNIPSQKDESNDIDMLSMVKNYIKEKYNKPGNVFVGLVHRLDRPTGGVIVFAKTSKAAKRLSEQIQSKSCQKKYLCILDGVLKQPNGVLENYLLKDERTNTVRCVSKNTNQAKYAKLSYKTIDVVSGLSLVEVNLFTGRSHQIRVQMKNAGAPIFGDAKYGNNIRNVNLSLWAYSLSFAHPTLKKEMCFVYYPPIENMPWSIFEQSIILIQ